MSPPAERFWVFVNQNGPCPPERPEFGPCWVWTGAPTKRGGYGLLGVAPRKQERAHRFSYELLVGPIPEGMEIDHLCRVHLCVRPDHLEAVTHRENVRRGRVAQIAAARMLGRTHCPKGHPYDERNTHYRKEGWRCCRACARERMAALKARRRAEQAVAISERGAA